MSNLRYKWLKWRGYKTIDVIKVGHRWDESNPITHYTAQIYMRKGLNFKTIKINQNVADILQEQFKSGLL